MQTLLPFSDIDFRFFFFKSKTDLFWVPCLCNTTVLCLSDWYMNEYGIIQFFTISLSLAGYGVFFACCHGMVGGQWWWWGVVAIRAPLLLYCPSLHGLINGHRCLTLYSFTREINFIINLRCLKMLNWLSPFFRSYPIKYVFILQQLIGT